LIKYISNKPLSFSLLSTDQNLKAIFILQRHLLHTSNIASIPISFAGLEFNLSTYVPTQLAPEWVNP
jgi:hypothetical protein